MKLKMLMAAPFLAAGCAGDPVVADRAGYDEAVRCAAFLEAVGIFYAALAEQSQDGPAAERASARSAAGAAFRVRAINLGAPLAKGRSDTERDIAAVASEIQREQGRRPFTDFAIWLGREADRCPRPPVEPPR